MEGTSDKNSRINHVSQRNQIRPGKTKERQSHNKMTTTTTEKAGSASQTTNLVNVAWPHTSGPCPAIGKTWVNPTTSPDVSYRKAMANVKRCQTTATTKESTVTSTTSTAILKLGNPSPGSSHRSGVESGAVAIIIAGSVLHYHSIVLCHHAHNIQLLAHAQNSKLEKPTRHGRTGRTMSYGPAS